MTLWEQYESAFDEISRLKWKIYDADNHGKLIIDDYGKLPSNLLKEIDDADVISSSVRRSKSSRFVAVYIHGSRCLSAEYQVVLSNRLGGKMEDSIFQGDFHSAWKIALDYNVNHIRGFDSSIPTSLYINNTYAEGYVAEIIPMP